MNSLHSLRTEWRSEWQMPQKRISICTSRSVGSRRLILVEASNDVALAAEYAFALKVVGCIPHACPLYERSQQNLTPRLSELTTASLPTGLAVNRTGHGDHRGVIG